MEDMEDLLILIEQELSQGRKPVLGTGTIINASVIYELIERIRNSIPEIIREARYIVQNSARMQKEESEKVQQMVLKAQGRADQILSEHEIVKIAQREAEAIKNEALEFKAKIFKEISKDIDIMLVSVEKTLAENLQIIRKAQQSNCERFGQPSESK